MMQANSSLPASFLQMREAEKLVDITLVFGERRVSCHKVILAGTCDYFHSMFLTDMMECASKEVVMKDISASTGALLVDYLYCGHIEFTTQNALDLLAASDMLLLDTLKENVEEFLCRNTESMNCISLLNLARLYDLKTLLEDARKFLHDHSYDVINTEEMHLLQEGDLIEMLAENYVQEDSFRFIQKWVRSAEGRTDRFFNLIQHVRLSQCCKEFLRSTIMEEKLMDNEQCMKLIQEAMLIDPPQQLVVGDFIGDMWKCSDSQHWQPIQKPPLQYMYVDYNACASPGGFIVSGGCDDNNISQHDCYSYDAHSNRWNTLPPMSTARNRHSSIYHNHHLYVVGGLDGSSELDGSSDLNSVEALDMRRLQWSHLPPLPKPLVDSYVAFVSNNLFVLGGINNDFSFSKHVYEYDSTQRTWRPRSPMPKKCPRGAAVSFDDRVYVVGGQERRCMRFNPRNNTWASLQRPQFDHYVTPSLVWNEKILICGGNDEDFIEEYSPLTNKWSTWALKMPDNNDVAMSFALRMSIPS